MHTERDYKEGTKKVKIQILSLKEEELEFLFLEDV